MKNKPVLLILMAVLLPLLVAGCAGKNISSMMGSGNDENMEMHHLHTMMNHGLTMVTEGSNTIMISYMGMAPKVDAIAHEHGHYMMNMGKGVINHSLSGPEMTRMMTGEHANTEHMKFTHKLGESMLVVVDLLEKMAKTGSVPEGMMDMHHQHLLINHAMSMAAQGANMVMLGNMDMAGDVDTYSTEHGKMMLANAQALLTEVMSGDAMMDMHAKGKTPEGHGDMMATHALGEAAVKVVDLLANMPKM
jgi:hypothetical protein